MTLATMADLAARATAAGAGIAALNVVQLEHAEAIASGAEAAGRPVILQVSENCIRYHGSPAPILRAVLAVAEESSAEVVVHLDHATDPALLARALQLGVTSVMFDASTQPHENNLCRTTEVCRWAHHVDAWVEAELGEIGGKGGVHAPGVRTDPDDAAAYVAVTGVDALAVAVGSAHAMTTRTADLDESLIARLAEAVAAPLVLHGSSGVPDDALQRAVALGIRKVNIGTHLNRVLTGVVRGRLADPGVHDPRTYLGPARDAVAEEVSRLLLLLAPDPY